MELLTVIIYHANIVTSILFSQCEKKTHITTRIILIKKSKISIIDPSYPMRSIKQTIVIVRSAYIEIHLTLRFLQDVRRLARNVFPKRQNGIFY